EPPPGPGRAGGRSHADGAAAWRRGRSGGHGGAFRGQPVCALRSGKGDLLCESGAGGAAWRPSGRYGRRNAPAGRPPRRADPRGACRRMTRGDILEAWHGHLTLGRRRSPHTVRAYAATAARLLDALGETDWPALARLDAGALREQLARRRGEG